jgi:hypothetical protein
LQIYAAFIYYTKNSEAVEVKSAGESSVRRSCQPEVNHHKWQELAQHCCGIIAFYRSTVAEFIE